MALKDIAINIKATGIDQTTQGLKAVEGAAGSMGRKTKSVTQQMREDMERTERSIGHSTGIIARSFEQLSMYVKSATAAFAGFKLTQQIQEATMFAANVQQADRALSVIANTMGRTSEEAMTYRNSLRDLGITTNSATNATAQFIKAGLPLDGLNKLGRAAQGAAISYQMMTGETISSSAALDKMIRALVTGNVTELHTLGINVMMRDTLRENKLATGEASTAVDTHKCHLLMFNDVLEKTEPLMLLYEKSMDLAAKQISSSKRPIEELKLALGNLFLPELTIAATQFYSTVSGGMKWVKSHGEELEATKSAILALSEAMWAAAKIGSSYLLIYKGIPAATAVWGWVTAKTALVAAEFKAQRATAAGTAVMLGSAQAAEMKAAATVAESAATVAATAEELRRAQVMTAGLVIEREAALAKLAGATSTQAQTAALTELAAISKAAAVAQEQLAVAERAATSATNAHTAALNALDVAAHKARTSMLSLANVMNVMMAAWIGWEIGTWLSNQFEWARKSGVYMVHGLMKGLDLAAEAYERFAATINPFGDEEKQQAQLEAITAKYAAIKKTRDDAFAGSLADAVTGGSKVTANPYQNDQKAIASGIAAETKRLKEEASRSATAAAEAADKAANAEVAQHNRFVAAYNGKLRAIEESSPLLTQHEKELVGVRLEYEKMLEQYPKEAAAIKELEEYQVKEVKKWQDMADAIAATSREFQTYLDVQENQPSQGNQAGEMNLRWESELEALKELQPSAGIDKLNDQIAMFERLLSDIPEKSAEVATAIARLKSDFAASSGLDSLLQSNRDIQTSLITDGFAREKQQLEDRYNLEKTLQEKALANATNDANKRAAIEEHLSLLKQEYAINSYQLMLAQGSYYTSTTGQLFSALADTQDQASRQGFESAKDYNLGAVVMNTASAVMAQYASSGWYGAAAAAAMGAIQYDKVSGTSYGGGSGYASSVGGSGSGAGSASSDAGSMRGTAYTSIAASQTAETMQQLAESMDNASVAMRKVSDGLTKFSGMLAGALAQLALGGINGKNADLSPGQSASGFILEGIKRSTVGIFAESAQSFRSLFSGDWAGFRDQLESFNRHMSAGNLLFGSGNGWRTNSAGVSLGISQGQLEGQGYNELTKKGGWLSSDKHRTDYSGLDAAFADMLSYAIADITSNTNLAATILGSGAGIGGVVIPQAKIETAGRSTEDIQADIENWLQQVGNEFAKTVYGLGEFAAPGEYAYATLMRLATSLQGVNEQFELIGHTILYSTLAGGNAASKLVDLMGGGEAFSEKMEGYFTSMFTQAEQDAARGAQATSRVNTAFADMNSVLADTNSILGNTQMVVPSTNIEFRDLVNSLNTTTESGAALFAAMMEVAPAFSEMTRLAKEFAEAQANLNHSSISTILRLGGSGEVLADLYDLQISQQEELASAVEAGLDTANLAIAQQLTWADAIKTATATIEEATRHVVDSAKKMLLDSISSTQTILGTMQDLLTGPAAMLSPEAAYNQAKAQFASADAGNVSERVTALLEASRNYNASGVGYQADYQASLAKLAQFAETTPTLSAVQQQLSLLRDIKVAVEAGDLNNVTALGITFNAAQITMGTANNALTLALAGIQGVLNTPITSGTSTAEIKAQIAALQGSLNTSVIGTARESINNSIAALQLAMNGSISAATAQTAINTAYSVVQGALNGTINGTTAATATATQAAIIQQVLNGTISGATATTALNAQASIIQSALNGAISATDAETKIKAQYDEVTAALGDGMSTALTSVSTALGLFNTAVQESATATATSLSKFIAALGLLDTFSRASNAYDTRSASLEQSYRSGGITYSQYQEQTQAAYAPVNSAYGAAVAGGVTGLPAPTTNSFTSAVRDMDEMMQAKAFSIVMADVFNKIEGWQGPMANGKPLWDLDKDGDFDRKDVEQWTLINNGGRLWHDYNVPAFATGGLYGGGSSIMGEYGPELVDSSPGYVYRADETRALFAMARRGAAAADNYTRDDREIVAELKEQNRLLREVVAELRAGHRMSQAGFEQLIDQGEQGDKIDRQMLRRVRLAGAK
ncbi:MAG: hypothetical protein A2075_09070 [Geobacteraceae bacterium GWC2_58_44]|nr:MAG: hypothetical protein A2075_09070 [Geobacteraceae bacterium GWC2_58_44]HBG07664.1 hypothetical protein [Geobacter sp.]